MNRRENRPAGAVALVLDPEQLLERGRDAFATQYPDEAPDLLNHGPLPQMMFAVDRGNHAIVNGEGVGSVADDTDQISVHFTYGMSIISIQLTLDAVATAVTEEKIDLRDGIRVFGDRLDSNHYRWYSRYDATYRP